MYIYYLFHVLYNNQSLITCFRSWNNTHFQLYYIILIVFSSSLVFCREASSWLPYLTSHILGKSREAVSRCLHSSVFTETPSPASVSFTIRPSSLFRDVGFAYTGKNSVVHHALSFHRGTTCRWRGGQTGQLGVEAF